MMKRMRYLLGLLLMLGSSLTVCAQYNPADPAEPGEVADMMYYKVSVSANIPEAGTVSGTGKYQKGKSVTVKATANSGYKFLYWTMDGGAEAYKTSTSFTHTMTTANVSFMAVFEKAKSVTVRLQDANAGTVSGSTSSLYKGGKTTVSTTPKTNYEFLHWLKNEETEPYSTARSFPFTMEDEDVVFTAVYRYVKPEYNPNNPSEPGDVTPLLSYHVNVSLADAEAGAVSGGGTYKYGTKVTVATSPNAGYEFRQWTKGGEFYSNASSFQYTVAGEDVDFCAEYEWVGIPDPVPTSHKLFLVSEPLGACTFSMASGTDVDIDGTYRVTVTPGTEQEFLGWYMNGSPVSTERTFSSIMANEDVTLTARFRYNPTDPDEPADDRYNGEPGRLKGDVNGDGKVTVADAISIISVYLSLSAEDTPDSIYDVNGDGKVTVSDAINAITIYLTTK